MAGPYNNLWQLARIRPNERCGCRIHIFECWDGYTPPPGTTVRIRFTEEIAPIRVADGSTLQQTAQDNDICPLIEIHPDDIGKIAPGWKPSLSPNENCLGFVLPFCVVDLVLN